MPDTSPPVAVMPWLPDAPPSLKTDWISRETLGTRRRTGSHHDAHREHHSHPYPHDVQHGRTLSAKVSRAVAAAILWDCTTIVNAMPRRTRKEGRGSMGGARPGSSGASEPGAHVRRLAVQIQLIPLDGASQINCPLFALACRVALRTGRIQSASPSNVGRCESIPVVRCLQSKSRCINAAPRSCNLDISLRCAVQRWTYALGDFAIGAAA